MNHWPLERILNGLRRYARDYFVGRESDLPQTFYAYRNAIPEAYRGRGRSGPGYPPFHAILRQFGSLAEAWRSAGFDIAPSAGKTVALNIEGLRFGFLTAVSYSHSARGNGRVWRCKCDCGNEAFVSAKHLRNGRQVSCGCFRRTFLAQIVGAKRFKDLRGQRFGRLTALSACRRANNLVWECRCDCGNVHFVRGSSLTRRTGNTLSCGCLRRDNARGRLNAKRRNEK